MQHQRIKGRLNSLKQ